MRHHTILLASFCSAASIILTTVIAVPLPANNQELDVLQIPLANGKEIDVLTLGVKDQEQAIAERNKRTIGLLRELFPDITKQLDGIVNRIIAQVIRVAGPSLLPALLGNNNRPTTARTDDDFNSSDFDDVEEDDDVKTENDIKGATGTRVQIELPTFAPDLNEMTSTTTMMMTSGGDDSRKNGASETQIDLSAINKQLEETIRVARQVKEAEAAAQAVANLQQQQKQQQQQSDTSSNQQPKLEESIQLSFNNEVLNSNENAKPVSNDLQSSESKSPAIDDLSLDSNEDQADLDDRNKRFLSLGGGVGGGGLAGSASGTNANVNAGAAGGPGGSGNFLFDIVRLFSGSVQTQNRDEAANSPKNNIGGGSNDDNDSNNTADGYTEGIPGPVTRLVVLANRGLANLVQDMILRVAATGEKFVNFNAKLITALI